MTHGFPSPPAAAVMHVGRAGCPWWVGDAWPGALPCEVADFPSVLASEEGGEVQESWGWGSRGVTVQEGCCRHGRDGRWMCWGCWRMG